MRWPCEERIPQREGFPREDALNCGTLCFGFPAAAIWQLQNPEEVSAEHFILMESVRYRAPFQEGHNIWSWMLPAGKLLGLIPLAKPRAIPALSQTLALEGKFRFRIALPCSTFLRLGTWARLCTAGIFWHQEKQ